MHSIADWYGGVDSNVIISTLVQHQQTSLPGKARARRFSYARDAHNFTSSRPVSRNRSTPRFRNPGPQPCVWKCLLRSVILERPLIDPLLCQLHLQTRPSLSLLQIARFFSSDAPSSPRYKQVHCTSSQLAHDNTACVCQSHIGPSRSPPKTGCLQPRGCVSLP